MQTRRGTPHGNRVRPPAQVAPRRFEAARKRRSIHASRLRHRGLNGPTANPDAEASAAGVRALLCPRSIAIVGASDKSRWSRDAFDNLTGGGFTGAVHLVNPRGGLVHGRAAAESCTAVGAEIDLGVVLVPGHAVEDAIRDLGAAGARSAVVLTSGFAETGPAGAASQSSLAAFARDRGIRLLGPNSLGFVNFVQPAAVWTTPIQAPSKRGGVAVVSQSGATAYFLANLAYQQDVGLSHVISTGNEADLDCGSFVEALLGDPDTRAIALFIETVRGPGRFVRAARAALDAGKPLVVLKVGAGEATARAALAHTGALVGDDRVFDGLCRQSGLVRVRAIEELLATADIMARTGVLRPGGLCVVSNSGGVCEIAADAAHLRGVPLPEVDAATAAVLRRAIPAFGTPHNPLDVTGGVTPEGAGAAVRAVAAQPDVAAVLCPWYEVPTAEEGFSPRLARLYEHLSPALNEAPVPGLLVSYTAAAVNAVARKIVAETGLPYLACGLDRAITGLAGAFWWSERHRDRAAAPAPSAGPDAASGDPAPVDPASGDPAPERPRSERDALAFLERHGVPVVPAALAADEAGALAAARRIGGPVAVKIASPDIAHKSDIGAVALGAFGDPAVADAFRRVTAAAAAGAPGARIDGVLVSPMRGRGIELFVGVSRDPQWGPVLAVGLGGIWVEVLQDVSLRLLPVGPAEIRRMLGELRGAKLLAGGRGVPAAGLDAVSGAIARIGEAALRLGPDLAALDVNPLWVRGDRVEALDALFVWDKGGDAPCAPTSPAP